MTEDEVSFVGFFVLNIIFVHLNSPFLFGGAGLCQPHIFESFEPLKHRFRFSFASDDYLATVRSGASIEFVEEVEELSELLGIHNVNQLGASHIGEVSGVATSEEVIFHFFVGITFEVARQGEVIGLYAEAILGNVGAFIKGDFISLAKLTSELEVEVLLDSLSVVVVLGNLSF